MRKRNEELKQRIRTLRVQYKMTQKELANAVNRLLPEGQRYVTTQNVSGWEVNGYVPRTEALRALAAVFHTDLDYLMGIADTKSEQAAEFGKFYRVNKDEILLYGQRPIYRTKNNDERGYWVLVDDITRTLVSTKGSVPITDLTDEDLLFTLEPPRKDTLTLKDAKDADKVFIRSSGFEAATKLFVDGFYVYNRMMQGFSKTDGTWSFPEDLYGVRYIGYKDVDTAIHD